jgi:2-polyprenyl-6-methoxyphenol hydroxylase-like FAD-dependent oxidoreductase
MSKIIPKPLKIGIVGYGPAGIIAAISLARNGHEVTMFERDNYGGERKMDLSTLDKTKTYPIDIGARGIQAVDYIGAYAIFEKYNNLFKGIKTNMGGGMSDPEIVAGFTGTRVELMWSLAEARELLAPSI